MPLDEDVTRLAKGKNLATVVTLMPSGQPQAQLRFLVSPEAQAFLAAVPGTLPGPARCDAVPAICGAM